MPAYKKKHRPTEMPCKKINELCRLVSTLNAIHGIPFNLYQKGLSNAEDFLNLWLETSEILCQNSSVPPKEQLLQRVEFFSDWFLTLMGHIIHHWICISKGYPTHKTPGHSDKYPARYTQKAPFGTQQTMKLAIACGL